MQIISILANDGLEASACAALQEKGFIVHTDKVEAPRLAEVINAYDALVVRSATRVDRPLIDAMQRTRLIVRAGVGLDNIDVAYARQKGIAVHNTPKASTRSVAELVFAHLLGLLRFVHDANRQMPAQGGSRFAELKKTYAAGREVQGKTLGLIGFGNIGQETARIALGMGMHVAAYDPVVQQATLHIGFGNQQIPIRIQTIPKAAVLQQADFLSLHASGKQPVLTEEDLNQVRPGVIIINCARGGLLAEDALLNALNSGRVAAAGLDVFEEEPPVHCALLQHPQVSLTPHIGASTIDAQQRIGQEIVDILCSFFNR